MITQTRIRLLSLLVLVVGATAPTPAIAQEYNPSGSCWDNCPPNADAICSALLGVPAVSFCWQYGESCSAPTPVALFCGPLGPF